MNRIALATLITLAGCTKPDVPPPAVRVVTVERVVEVQKPCAVTIPVRPAPLAKPLPVDAVSLAAVLALKLGEWSAPGAYGDRADAALKRCAKP